MELTVILIIALVVIAVAFDFTNGFHDAANAIATVVATKALTMNQALAMAAGTYSGGRKIIETAGEKITKLNQESGFIANISGSITIFLASLLGMPVSTTHVVVSSITGAGLADARHQKSTASSRGVQGMVKSSGTAVIGEGMGEAIALAEPELGLEDEPKQAINWNTWKNMATAWIFTLPGSALVGGLMYLVLSFLLIR